MTNRVNHRVDNISSNLPHKVESFGIRSPLDKPSSGWQPISDLNHRAPVMSRYRRRMSAMLGCPMAKKALKYFYRASFRPDLELFDGFDSGLGGDKRGLGYAEVWHRGNLDKYTVVNELVAAEIGRFLRLPIPPSAITRHDDEWLFSSLDFNFARAKLPQVEAEPCLERLGEVSAGVLLFDVLIANEDRHSENLVVDRVRRPSKMFVFDHDQSLFSGFTKSGIERLIYQRNRLGIVKEMHSGTKNHVFMDHVNTSRFMQDWISRIWDIPRWFIEDICKYCAVDLGITRDERSGLVEFLIHRRDNIENITKANAAAFPLINDWWWLPQADGQGRLL